MPRLSLVIPCYNEAANLPLLLARLDEVVADADRGADMEAVLVDNGSGDDTATILQRAAADRPWLRPVAVAVNQGYGHGILAGLAEARGDILAWSHADMQTDPADALRGLEFFAGPDGARIFVKGRRHGRPFADSAFTVAMSAFETVLLGRPMWDINAQPTMFTRAFFATWRAPPEDFSLDLYAYHRARAEGLRIRRFPVRFGERAHGTSHWNVDWRAKLRFIRRTVAYSFELRRRLRTAP